jgi:beta-glucosidase
MCSYNLINGSWACQNSKTLNGVLKTDFGFQGYVMSDWTATHSGVLAANSGLDMDMPGDVTFGSIPAARLDDMAQRIIASWFLLRQDQDYPAVNFDAFRRTAPENNSHVDVRDDHFK